MRYALFKSFNPPTPFSKGEEEDLKKQKVEKEGKALLSSPSLLSFSETSRRGPNLSFRYILVINGVTGPKG